MGKTSEGTILALRAAGRRAQHRVGLFTIGGHAGGLGADQSEDGAVSVWKPDVVSDRLGGNTGLRVSLTSGGALSRTGPSVSRTLSVSVMRGSTVVGRTSLQLVGIKHQVEKHSATEVKLLLGKRLWGKAISMMMKFCSSS